MKKFVLLSLAIISACVTQPKQVGHVYPVEKSTPHQIRKDQDAIYTRNE